MTTTLDTFVRRHVFLVCVDSDGCAIDNLTAKHRLCFAPCLIREWRLEAWSDRVTALWERINLNSLTRGIHRYRALALALEEIHRDLTPVEDLPVLIRWVSYTDYLKKAFESIRTITTSSERVTTAILRGGSEGGLHHHPPRPDVL